MKNTIVICSEARGGSTWLMELLSNIPNSIINWEPLHVTNGVIASNLKLGWRPLIYKDNNDNTIKKKFEKIFMLKTYNKWTLRYVDIAHLKGAKYVITKFVRFNQSLPWLVHQFPALQHKPIFLLRHPITTCISRLKTFEKETDIQTITTKQKLGSFTIPNCLNNERYIQHKTYIESLESQLEREIAIWCINNVNLIEHPDNDKWITLYYEDLVLNPKIIFEGLLKNLNVQIPNNVLDKIQYRKASSSDYLKLFKRNPKQQLMSFLKDLDEPYLEKVQDIFNYFDLKVYSAYKAWPIKNNI
ncbi:sulfotransferase [Marixanthomonas sp. SCSIO 43207]|uniref:sulfotransferase n=1 Tax=Marixanthomonas sp. SCSIO 43207 TaxID=2779360 RepID=UPI001CA999A2|nr:sulfotransferase [Marixanthomonas sp. SCSIO 43207]UAB81226.1 sulfotransferase [Marixanthomonas sp. SCSIO 43207]